MYDIEVRCYLVNGVCRWGFYWGGFGGADILEMLVSWGVSLRGEAGTIVRVVPERTADFVANETFVVS